MQLPEQYFRFGMKPIVFGSACVPVVWLALGAWNNTLGANPIEVVTRQLGEWAVLLLLFTLSISTAKRLFNWGQLLRLRRMLGVFSFFYATLHVLSYLWLDQFFDWSEVWHDVLTRPFITVGMLAFLMLVPLVLTSFKWAMRALGRHWQRLHRLVYVLTALALLHFWWLADSKARTDFPLVYTCVFVGLMLERVWFWSVRSRSNSNVLASVTRK